MISTLIFTLLIGVSFTDAGVSFVRWGRRHCPEGTKVLYTGYMAGPHNNVGGSGSNYLCLPDKPQYSPRNVPGIQRKPSSPAGAIYGVEMQGVAALPNAFLKDNLPSSSSIENQDMACAVCYDNDASDVLMIPARLDCYETGYKLKYTGILSSQAMFAGKHRGEYICMDEAPTVRRGGSESNGQGSIYPVEIICGSIPCDRGTYTNGMEATCAVCTF